MISDGSPEAVAYLNTINFRWFVSSILFEQETNTLLPTAKTVNALTFIKRIMFMQRIIFLIVLSIAFATQSCNMSKGVQKRANDDAAISIVKKVREAQVEFETRHGKGNYGLFEDLTKENLISSEIADGIEQGYKYTLEVETGKYSLQAVPIEYGTENSEGNFSLYLDQSRIIRSATKKGIDTANWEIAGPNSIPIKE